MVGNNTNKIAIPTFGIIYIISIIIAIIQHFSGESFGIIGIISWIIILTGAIGFVFSIASMFVDR